MSNEFGGPPTVKWRSVVSIAVNEIGVLINQKKIYDDLDKDLIDKIDRKRASSLSIYYKFYFLKCISLGLLFLSQFGDEMSLKIFNIEAKNIANLKELLFFISITFFVVTVVIEIHNNYCLNIIRELVKKKFPAEVRLGLSVAYYWEDCGSILTPAGRAGLSRLAICMYAAGFLAF